MQAPVLQSRLPKDQRAAAAAPLPRMRPVAGHWITVDNAYGAQIALRQRLLAERRDSVLRVLPGAQPALADLLEETLGALAAHPRFGLSGDAVTCPDGRIVRVDPARPLDTLCALLSEDLCLLERRGGEHVLTAALLCFPAGWTLAEKIGRPLTQIHRPVPSYDDAIAARVQRFFDAVRPGQPLWRANLHGHMDPDLFSPRRETDPRDVVTSGARFLRSERQTVLRLRQSGAVLFAIHTTMVRSPG